ncbi:MAG: GDP-mannose 4,6-dehydratase, partial [Candidatus Bathyarchaeota archaeon]|nr:GDP-mannose 4,6-dehydratase [Candidatus Termiticorpusculum sp.]
MIDNIIREDLESIKKTVKGDIFTGKKILVTGGAGFIGSWICDLLIDFGAQVTVVDDLSTGRIKNIDHLIQHSQLKFIQTDVCTFRSDENFNFIFHMAGHASPDEYQTNPIETLQ